MKIKEILEKVKCKCGNNDFTKFQFVCEINPKKRMDYYIYCLKCGEMYRYDMKLKKIIVDGIFIGG